MNNRQNCEHFDRCGKSGHYQTKTGWQRCQCLMLEMHKTKLGMMYTNRVEPETPLSDLTDSNLLLNGSLNAIRGHVARVLLDNFTSQKRWLSIDAYRLLDIFLSQDKEISTQSEVTEPDMLIMLLGFGDPRNAYLPELINQVLSRRDLTGKPTWVVLGIELPLVATKYSAAVLDKLNTFKRVNIQ